MQDMISIHAPARGATILRATRYVSANDFNPRTRAGCDDYVSLAVSATDVYFNPRTRAGCDVSKILKLIKPGKFQSTHPRGVRLYGRADD